MHHKIADLEKNQKETPTMEDIDKQMDELQKKKDELKQKPPLNKPGG